MKFDVNANDPAKDDGNDWAKQEVRKKISHFYNATITHSHSTQFNRNAWKKWEKAAKNFENTVTSHVGWSRIVGSGKTKGMWKISLIFTLQQSHTHIQFNRNAWNKWWSWNFFKIPCRVMSGQPARWRVSGNGWSSSRMTQWRTLGWKTSSRVIKCNMIGSRCLKNSRIEVTSNNWM